MQIQTLSFGLVPPELELTRALPTRCEIRDENVWQSYDQTTLFYDVVHCSQSGLVKVFMPKLFNLKHAFLASSFLFDDTPIKIHRLIEGRQFDVAVFKVVSKPNIFRVVMSKNAEVTARVNTRDTTISDANILFTMSKDNPLEWIKDWAQFHVRQHGTDTIVIIDNDSDTYNLEDILECLSSINNLKHIRILNAPLPFGPSQGDCTHWSLAKFLQVAMLNLGFWRFGMRNSVFLNLDVDELLMSRKDNSIYDKIRQKPFGYMTFPGEWYYATDRGQRPMHSDHFLYCTDDKPCPTKYAIHTDSILSKLALKVHNLNYIDRRFFKSKDDFYFLHCRQISTSWKYDRSSGNTKHLQENTWARNKLEIALNQTSSQ
ncbi:hypothetical protein J7382_05705 [Shimia sp. R11_0]|uniref:hypothetical protein n=1 Tax=Shimia sp. R11_0 TaxID=2821096 RepID=UPI001ADAEED7|nr:hypothetical protein [Shimia sp. R11_0]MBO9477022.1 hypothetical protein [Shimia sp. R11_0]